MKTRKLNTQGKLLLLILGIIIAIIIVLCIPKNHSTQEKHIIKEEKNYQLKISYPILHQKKIDQEIQKFIQKQEKQFLNNVTEDKKLNKDLVYDLIIDYQQTNWRGIEIIHFKVQQYTGGNHYVEEDYSYYYHKKNKKFLSTIDFLEKDWTYLAQLSYYQVMEFYSKNNWPLNDAYVKDGTSSDIQNYKHINLTEKGMEIIFPPYQAGPWVYGTISITIPFEKLNGILKKQYMGVTKEEKVVVPLKQPNRELNSYKNQKLIAITFDDGPGDATTSHLLDGLKELNARVTFFLLGSRVDRYPEIVKRIYLEGHQVGNHTYNHKNLLRLTDYEVHNEIEATNQAVKNIIGVEPKLLRPPYGNINDMIKQISHMNIILWNVDSADWKLKNKDKIAEMIVSHAHDGAIILLHDIYNASVEGALEAIKKLKEEGYAFVTIEEMATLKEIKLDSTKSYYSFK